MGYIEEKYWQIHSSFDNSQKNVDEHHTYISLIIGVQKSNNVEYNNW